MNVPSPHRASVITVLNLKGGVGKTHASWLLASVCDEQGKRLLAIDTDPQGNLSSSFLSPEETEPGLERLFNPALDVQTEGLIRRTAFSHVDVIPTSPTLARFDISDQRQWEAADLHLTLVEPVFTWRPLYDYIVFDCPPRLSLVSFAALCASDFVIIPLEAADWGGTGHRASDRSRAARQAILQPALGTPRLPRLPLQARPHGPADVLARTSDPIRRTGF